MLLLATTTTGRLERSMRRIINSTYISLDGVVEQPHTWPTLDGRPGDERGGRSSRPAAACDAVLMGRRTYDGFAPSGRRGATRSPTA